MPESLEKKEKRKVEIDSELNRCGFDRILKIVTRDFSKYFLPCEKSLYQYLSVQTFGFNRNTVEKSFRELERETGITKKTLVNAAKHLIKVGLIGKEQKGDSSTIWWIQKIKYPRKDSPEYAQFEKLFRTAHLNREREDEKVLKVDNEIMVVIRQAAKRMKKSQKALICECLKASPLYQKLCSLDN